VAHHYASLRAAPHPGNMNAKTKKFGAVMSRPEFNLMN
jgi:hypothetical protein